MQSSVTTYDIALIAGVSQPVVSKALHACRGNVGVSDTTRARILRVAREVGYRSNSAARAMRTGRFNCAALLLSANPVTSLLPPELFHGLLDAAANEGLHLAVARFPDAKLVSAAVVPRLLTELFADGLLINYNAKIPRALIELIDRHRIPSVWLNSMHPSDCVYPDDHAAALQLTQWLVESGHRRVGYFNDSGLSHYSALERRRGYIEAMTAAGLAPQVVEGSRIPAAQRLALAGRFVRGRRRATAVVCYTTRASETVCQAALAAGLSPLSDLTVGTFDDRPIHWHEQAVPTMVLPQREIAAAAVAMLLKKIERPAERLHAVAMPCRLAKGS